MTNKMNLKGEKGSLEMSGIHQNYVYKQEASKENDSKYSNAIRPYNPSGIQSKAKANQSHDNAAKRLNSSKNIKEIVKDSDHADLPVFSQSKIVSKDKEYAKSRSRSKQLFQKNHEQSVKPWVDKSKSIQIKKQDKDRQARKKSE